MKDFKRATLYSAGYDIFVEGNIPAGEAVRLKTDINLFGILKKNQFGLLVARSSLFMKHNLIIPNTPRIIDADFDDCFSVELYNPTKKDIYIEDRVAQIIFQEYQTYENEVIPTKTRTGGFGSTNNDNDIKERFRVSKKAFKTFQKIVNFSRNEIVDFIHNVKHNTKQIVTLNFITYGFVIKFNGVGEKKILEATCISKELDLESRHVITMLFRAIESELNINDLVIVLDDMFTNVKRTKESKYKQIFDCDIEDFYL